MVRDSGLDVFFPFIQCVIYLVTSFLGFDNLFVPLNAVHLTTCFVTTLVCQIVTYFKLIHDDDSAEWLYISDIISLKFMIMLVEFLLLSLQLTHLVYAHLVDSLVNLVIYCRRGSNNLQVGIQADHHQRARWTLSSCSVFSCRNSSCSARSCTC